MTRSEFGHSSLLTFFAPLKLEVVVRSRTPEAMTLENNPGRLDVGVRQRHLGTLLERHPATFSREGRVRAFAAVLREHTGGPEPTEWSRDREAAPCDRGRTL